MKVNSCRELPLRRIMGNQFVFLPVEGEEVTALDDIFPGRTSESSIMRSIIFFFAALIVVSVRSQRDNEAEKQPWPTLINNLQAKDFCKFTREDIQCNTSSIILTHFRSLHLHIFHLHGPNWELAVEQAELPQLLSRLRRKRQTQEGRSGRTSAATPNRSRASIVSTSVQRGEGIQRDGRIWRLRNRPQQSEAKSFLRYEFLGRRLDGDST